jgi:uncharacterized protein YndB with AHSA1/START domain
MTRIFTAIQIRQPIERVFDFVTTAGNWPRWHPSSLGVTGATDHPGLLGEKITEEFLVAGRRGRVVWTVREREEPRRWVIEGVIQGQAGGGTVTYTLTACDQGTFFEREFVYPTPSLWFALLDWLVIRRRVTAESAEALRRLKQVLESAPEAGVA